MAGWPAGNAVCVCVCTWCGHVEKQTSCKHDKNVKCKTFKRMQMRVRSYAVQAQARASSYSILIACMNMKRVGPNASAELKNETIDYNKMTFCVSIFEIEFNTTTLMCHLRCIITCIAVHQLRQFSQLFGIEKYNYVHSSLQSNEMI